MPLSKGVPQCFCYWRISVKSRPEKYNFDLQKGFLLRKMAQIRQILNWILFLIARVLWWTSRKWPRILEGSCFISTFCSQIWLTYIIYDHHQFLKRNPQLANIKHWQNYYFFEVGFSPALWFFLEPWSMSSIIKVKSSKGYQWWHVTHIIKW